MKAILYVAVDSMGQVIEDTGLCSDHLIEGRKDINADLINSDKLSASDWVAMLPEDHEHCIICSDARS